MIKSVSTRVLRAAITLFAVCLVVFVTARLSGNPVDTMLPPDATAEDRANLIARMGLDRPWYVQFIQYIGNALTGDFGESLRFHQPVTDIVLPRLLASVLLSAGATAVALVISLPLGVKAATNRGKAWDRIAMGFALIGQSVPTFLSGIIAILFLSVKLGWFPVSGGDSLAAYVLPAVTLGWFISAGIVRLLRSSMLDVLGSEYVKLARTKGVSERFVVWKHALSNALLPVTTYVGFTYGVLLGASVATEVVFNFPGLGRLAFDATANRDFPLLQFTVLTWAAVLVFINLAVEAMSVVLDPKQR